MFNHFLIPTDGSPVSSKAVKSGIALARKLGAKITAYCAIEHLETVYAEGYVMDQKTIDRLEGQALSAAQKHVDAISKLAKAAGIRFASVVAKSYTPYEGIIKTAIKKKCDVIFMASHGRRGLSRLIMGSVTQKVLSHSKIPVVVYR